MRPKRNLRRVTLAAAFTAMMALGFSSWPAPSEAATTPKRLTAYNWAVTQRGAPYVWGGSGPYWAGYDCSGLVMAAYAHAGISLPHNTVADVDSGKLIWEQYPRKGDLAMFGPVWAPYHVELWDGGHTTFGATGDRVWWHGYGGWYWPVFWRVRGAG